ncbi:hypothetical protein ASPZODRAFT_18134 [Penicilliopsis zonata CBS 506.65]|uniref:Helix-turn-helix domain-containing protein n=1 Tax=Penicilliopsis zonata CBS 506.65 TaxID=1073090 RepID=A0A1L9SBU1_9EURO|nr:hypothetical protein ASPZODRAFT_18134 [Penicilliopsis zonata CBS 506.65]OJJ44557.1 hypothetical protein ASPZODRAFT_18134 [Penicilliopsis zonata CBS 506.65]
MGSSASKPARSAAAAATRRQYPKQASVSPPTAPKTRSSPQPRPATRPGPTYHSTEQASSTKSKAIDLDGRDPDFAASLRSIGPVTPVPTLSNSSIFNRDPHSLNRSQNQTHNHYQPAVFPSPSNPALLVVTARQRLTQAAEREAEAFGRQSHAGREFLDILTIRQALSMRDSQGVPEAEVEKVLRLKKGVLSRLGRGVVSEIG